MSTPEPDPQASLGNYEAVPFRPDGGIAFAHALQLTGILGLTGIALGIVASFISRYFWFVAVFPILIGCVIGGIGTVCIKRMHIRHAAYCGVAVLVAGALAMLAMHYNDFKHFESVLRQDLGPMADEAFMVARNIDAVLAPGSNATPDEVAFALELRNDPQFLRVMQVDSLPKFLDYYAEMGVEIGNGPGQANMNLGYYGSYIYWFVEAALVAGFAFGLMRNSASEPYCADCMQWKSPFVAGFYADPDRVVRALESGRLERFTPMDLVDQPVAKVTLYPCAACGEQARVDVFVEQLSKNKKGEIATKRLARLTYPAQSLPALSAAFGIDRVSADVERIDGESPFVDEESGN
jgi:hypothetical protein